MEWLKILVDLLGWSAVAATAMPFSRSRVWWVRIFDFPRAHVALLAASSAAALPLIGLSGADSVLLAALAAALLVQLYWIYPYTRVVAPEVLPARADRAGIRLMVANVRIGNRRTAVLREHLTRCRPDLLLALEVDPWWDEQLRFLDRRYPFKIGCPLGNSYGISLHSRFELLEPEIRFLVQDDVPSIRCKIRLGSGVETRFYGVHPRPPTPHQHDRSTERDAELVLIGRECAPGDRPTIVAGDLNDVAWSRTTLQFRRISRLLDPRIGRGFYGTFHANLPLLRWPLDHVFHSKHFRLAAMEVLSPFGSDHLPVFAALSVEPEGAGAQNKPDPLTASEAGDAQQAVKSARRRSGAG